MSQDILYSLTGVTMFCIGLFGVLVAAHIIRKLVAINVMGIGVFMVLLATAQHDDVIDPIPHAMVLTGIVVAVAGTALCLWLALQLHQLNLKQEAREGKES